MKSFLRLALSALAVSVFMSGCAQKVMIKALNPAEVGEMASKKKVAVSGFKNDKVGLSGKVESMLSRYKLDNNKYFTVLSRKDLEKIVQEQKLQSSELMDENTATKVGKLIGAQAIINGKIASAEGKEDSYMEDREKCLKYVKDQGCVKYRYYKVKCNTTQATVSASFNIVDVENGIIIYGDTLSKDYSADSCKSGKSNLGLLTLTGAPRQILSKSQAISKLATQIANEFVYKLTPHYIYFKVTLLDSIELENVTDKQEKIFEHSLAYIKAGRMEKAKTMLQGLLDDFNGKSYVVAYDYGVVNEAQGDFDEAKKYYAMADKLTIEPIDEINSAIKRIDGLIAKRDEARKQMNTK